MGSQKFTMPFEQTCCVHTLVASNHHQQQPSRGNHTIIFKKGQQISVMIHPSIVNTHSPSSPSNLHNQYLPAYVSIFPLATSATASVIPVSPPTISNANPIVPSSFRPCTTVAATSSLGIVVFRCTFPAAMRPVPASWLSPPGLTIV